LNKQINNPPQIFLRFFRWYCHPQLKKYIEGDLMELYDERTNESGKRNADIKFIIDVVLLFRPSIIKPFERSQSLNQSAMFKSYFKIGWRNLLRNKGYSFINIGGLALGMAVAILISLWVYDELSFNKYHENYDRIAKVYRNDVRLSGEVNSVPVHTTGLGTLLKNDYAAHFDKVVLIRWRTEERIIAIGDKKFNQKGYFMQPDGVAMFSLKMKQGTWAALDDMKSIILSESLAKKIFDKEDPINQVITMDAKWDLKVTGVYEDLPKNSEFTEASYFAPLDLYLEGWSHLTVWDNYNMNIYVQLRERGDAQKISSVIKDAMLPHIDEESAKAKQPALFLLPMSQWHLFSQFKNGVPVTSERMKFVFFCTIIGVFVLILACINFMNLSTARSEKRAKEVGIRKSIGSYRTQLIYQFYSESFLVSFLSFVLSLILIKICLPGFNAIADKTISMPWSYPLFWPACLSFVILTALLAGSYPALYLSSFNPVKVLKGTFKAGRFASLPRRVLVVVQFTVSVSLIIATIVVYQQIEFAKNRPVGYSREGLMSLHSRSPEFKGKYNVLRNEFKKTGAALEIAESNYSITSTLGWNGGFKWKGKETIQPTDPAFNINRVTHEYGKTIGWQFIEGRDFSRDFPSDLAGVVINATAMKIIGLKNPVGETLTEDRDGTVHEFKILGVIKDVVKGSPFEPTDACLYFLSEGDMEWIYIRINPNMNPHEAISKIETMFNQLITTSPFDYRFADEEYDAKFRSEESIGTLAAIFSSLAILISCSGLFGLVSFVAEQRTKEIGIRKVLGASVASLWRMLTEDFVRLACISSLIASPIAYYFLQSWLEGYQYRIEMSWWIFIIATAATLLIIVVTVSFQAVKAALANPVTSLRSE
jgi:putative ABC transport system permease protein